MPPVAMQLNQFPYLPLEIVYLILESLAVVDLKSSLQLVLVSRAVQAVYAFQSNSFHLPVLNHM